METKMETERHMRVAAYALLLDEQDRILLCHLSEVTDAPGSWTLPGGGIEFGEHPRDAVVREVREETGYEIELDEVIGVDSIVFNGSERQVHSLRIVYTARVVGGAMRHELNGSTDRCEWFSLHALKELPLVRLVNLAIEMATA
ncbi:MAG: NUDIX domain-containing protein [Chthonomonas sp.]|nr:NUDIX domain-containing protein [Chthonomonas sp.]